MVISAVWTDKGSGGAGVFGVSWSNTFRTDRRRPAVLRVVKLSAAVALTRLFDEGFHGESAAAYNEVVREVPRVETDSHDPSCSCTAISRGMV